MSAEIPAEWNFPRVARTLPPTADTERKWGYTFRFRVNLSDLENARSAFMWGIYRINHGRWDPKKHQRGFGVHVGRRHKHLAHITIEAEHEWGIIIRVRSRYISSPVEMADFIRHEVNFQAVPRQMVSDRKFVPGKRSKRTGRIITMPSWTPAVWLPYTRYNVPYILTIKLLPPQYYKYYGHNDFYSG